MFVFKLIPVVIAMLVLGAHYLRDGRPGLVIACVSALGLLAIPRAWVPRVMTVLLVAAAGVWVQTAIELAQIRESLGAPYLRMTLILGGVALFTAVSPLLFLLRSVKKRFGRNTDSAAASTAAFLITAGLLAIVQLKVETPALLPERFLSGGGWIVVLVLSGWAAGLTELMLDPARQSRWRRRAWGLFSVVFFAQLALGLLGQERFLMTGELHLPVPALIAAGPLFRGEGLFMPILFGSTLLLVGPAWCSHLCYIGAWDSALASSRKGKPRALPRWTRYLRVGILVVVLAAAIGLRLAGASSVLAGGLALGFGLIGVGAMLLVSRRFGTMAHCTVYCPIGLLADVAGKVSPFRIRIGDACTKCGKCSKICRYDALSSQDIEDKRPALTCSLCGDCVGTCKDGQIGYRFAGLSPDRARTVFVVLAAALHAAFLGVARM
ncbi:MAG: 4Fe-4S binding protein [Deltaproteobacteria bacterium]|nr:4Fe-4S binding protein [Deltaproteobacteria bacterium]